MANIVHPYAPHAAWRFAVSRRFRGQHVDALYTNVIQPVLSEEGLVLECNYAGESTEDADFWMNRMSLILEIADIHILIDIDRSPNVEWEFKQSERIIDRHVAPTLQTTFGWDLRLPGIFFPPISIAISESEDQSSFSICTKSKAKAPTTATASRGLLRASLQQQIEIAKQRRLGEIQKAGIWFSKRKKFFVHSYDDFLHSLVTMTAIAKKIIQYQSVDEVFRDSDAFVDASEQRRMRGIQACTNERRQWDLELMKGKVVIPRGFWETHRLLLERNREGMAIAFLLDMPPTKRKGLAPEFRMRILWSGLGPMFWFFTVFETFILRRRYLNLIAAGKQY